jgi:hypothetical protein
VLAGMPSDELPRVRRVLPALPGVTAEQQFAWALDMLVVALEARDHRPETLGWCGEERRS